MSLVISPRPRIGRGELRRRARFTKPESARKAESARPYEPDSVEDEPDSVSRETRNGQCYPRPTAYKNEGVKRQLHRIATIEVVGHRQPRGADRLLVPVQVGFGDRQRSGDRGRNLSKNTLRCQKRGRDRRTSDDDRRRPQSGEKHDEPELASREPARPAPTLRPTPRFSRIGDDRTMEPANSTRSKFNNDRTALG